MTETETPNTQALNNQSTTPICSTKFIVNSSLFQNFDKYISFSLDVLQIPQKMLTSLLHKCIPKPIHPDQLESGIRIVESTIQKK